ncbi:hypothetical protein, conserved [Babesia ovata]|uniref:Uncharacterized protein n=1 Tax=Babesia ovata TaxID=189622 RepID=A0A2H6KEB8_9APIC|nr:uncharacterized protein BOVATA_028170 [Babesia ovata]GBE61324.1 hypothetical protein, conserved [Babesia ovata]
MVYNLLTTAPHNLKDAIDWLMAIKGTDSVDALGEAVHKVLSELPVGFKLLPSIDNMKRITKRFLEQDEIKDQWLVGDLLQRYDTRMTKDPEHIARALERGHKSDCHNIVETRGLKPEDVTTYVRKIVDGCENFLEHVKNPDTYVSTYSENATWDASCSKYPEGCAKVLIGTAPILYAGLQSLWNASTPGLMTWTPFSHEKHLRKVLKAVGYKEPEYRANIGPSDVRNALSGLDGRVLYTIYDIAGFWGYY